MYIILGLGKSGKAVASFCHRNHLPAVIVDDKMDASLQWVEEKGFSFSVMDTEDFLEWEFDPSSGMICVTSPGIPYEHPAFQLIEELCIPIISEIELALRVAKELPPLIGVTGTNGKTTVVELITHILNFSGKKAKAVGNIGTPLIEAINEKLPDWFVVELSSFQLALTSSPKFSIGCWLNISPNHLDWHASMEEYVQAKERLFTLIRPDGAFFMQECIPSSFKGSHIIRYGSAHESILRSDEGRIFFRDEESLFPKKLVGAPQHDRDNYLVAYGVARTAGIDKFKILEAYETFSKPSHRIEFVEKIGAVSYFDDSKSTNVASTEAALSSCEAPIILIAGGVHKGSSYSPWGNFSGKLRAIVAIGEAKERIAQDVGEVIPVMFAGSLLEAVGIAREMIASGTVLLSPGCSSFDMFRDYKDRGRQFKEIVRSLRSWKKK